MQEDKKEEEKKEPEKNAEIPVTAPEPVIEEKKEKTIEDILQEKDENIAEMTDKYLRALAEQDNYRKRMQKDKEDFIKFTRSEIVLAFLPVVDNFERAITSADKSKDFAQLKKGIDMVLKQFENTMKDMGVKEIPAHGIFDPNNHHVVHKEHVDGKKDGEILEVFQKGYILDGKVVRPSMVKVAINEVHKKENHEHKKDEHKNNENKK
ncbi:MAG: nucleotide exchange factor GrpE [bacterium]